MAHSNNLNPDAKKSILNLCRMAMVYQGPQQRNGIPQIWDWWTAGVVIRAGEMPACCCAVWP